MKKSAPRQPSRTPGPPATRPAGQGGLRRMCAIREGPPRQFPASLSGERTRLIIMHADKWVNGTVVKYAFFEASGSFKRWAGTDALRSQVKKAFQRYTDIGVGVRFEPVADRAARAGPHRLRAGRRPLVVHRARRSSSRAWTTAR